MAKQWKELTMAALQNTFEAAVGENATYVAIVVTVPGSDRSETIINHRDSFAVKRAYYENTYDENLHHVAAPLCVLGHTYGNSFAEIEQDLAHFYGDLDVG